MDRLEFRANLLLPNGQRWGDVWEPWQVQRIFRPLDATNPDGTPRYMLIYVQLHVGAAKSTHAAAQGLVDLVFGGAHQQLHLIAVDKDQADIIFRIAKGFIDRAAEARDPIGLEVYKNTIRNPENGSVWYRHSSDVPSSSGHDVYRLYADEIQNAPNADLFNSFYLRLGKQRPHSQALVLGNAGWSKDQIAWTIYQEALAHPEYAYCWAPEDFRAGFIQDLDRLSGTLTPVEYDRLIRNIWRFGHQTVFTEAMLAECVDGALTYPGPADRGESGVTYHAGIDFGRVKDRAAAALVRRTRTPDPHTNRPVDEITLIDLAVWQGSKTDPVKVSVIEDWLADRAWRFRLGKSYADPYQMYGTIDKFEGVLEGFTYSRATKVKLSKLLWTFISAGHLHIPDDQLLVTEILDLVEVQTPHGAFLDHEKGKHDDRVQAIGMAMQAAMEGDAPDESSHVSRASVAHSTHGWQRVPNSTISGRVAEVNRHGRIRYVRAASPSRTDHPATEVAATRAMQEKQTGDGEFDAARDHPAEFVAIHRWNSRTGQEEVTYQRKAW